MSWKTEFPDDDHLCEDSEGSEKLVLHCEKENPAVRAQAYVYSIIALPPTQPLDARYFGILLSVNVMENTVCFAGYQLICL